MNCHRYAKLVDAYVDGELPIIIAASLEEHVQVCDGCSLRLRDARGLRVDTLDASPSESLKNQIWNMLKERTWVPSHSPLVCRARKANPLVLRLGMAGALAFALVVGGAMLVTRSSAASWPKVVARAKVGLQGVSTLHEVMFHNLDEYNTPVVDMWFSQSTSPTASEWVTSSMWGFSKGQELGSVSAIDLGGVTLNGVSCEKYELHPQSTFNGGPMEVTVLAFIGEGNGLPLKMDIFLRAPGLADSADSIYFYYNQPVPAGASTPPRLFKL